MQQSLNRRTRIIMYREIACYIHIFLQSKQLMRNHFNRGGQYSWIMKILPVREIVVKGNP